MARAYASCPVLLAADQIVSFRSAARAGEQVGHDVLAEALERQTVAEEAGLVGGHRLDDGVDGVHRVAGPGVTELGDQRLDRRRPSLRASWLKRASIR